MPRHTESRRLMRGPVPWWVATWLSVWLMLALLLLPHNMSATDTTWTRYSFFDFRDTVWIPIRDFLSGHLPWDTSAYLARHPGIQDYVAYVPSYWLFLWPLALLPYPVAVVAWLGVTSACLVALVRFGLQLSGRAVLASRARTWRGWLPLVCFMGMFGLRPVKSALYQGQFALPCALAALIALSRRDDSRWTVACVALAIVKPPVGVPLVIVLLATRRWRPVVSALVVSTLLCAPVLAVIVSRAGGWEHAVRLLLDTLSDGSGVVAGTAFTYVDPASVISQLLPHVPIAINLCIVLATLVLTLRPTMLAWRHWGALDARYLVSASLAMVLITPNMVYALVIMLPALCGAIGQAVSCRRRGELERSWCWAAVALALGIPMLVPSSFVTHARVSIVASNAILAGCLVCAALLMWVMVARESRPRSPLPE